MIKIVHAESGADCVLQCLLEDESCRSVNFWKHSDNYNTTHNCELLKYIDSEIPDLLYEDVDFDYLVLLQPNRVSRSISGVQLYSSSLHGKLSKLAPSVMVFFYYLRLGLLVEKAVKSYSMQICK